MSLHFNTVVDIPDMDSLLEVVVDAAVDMVVGGRAVHTAVPVGDTGVAGGRPGKGCRC